jgi:putrescine transport system substrate-binding protein
MAWILSWHALLRSSRSVVKKSWTIIATYIFLSFSLSAKEVRVYNWSDYIDQSVIDQFEESTGIKVIYDVFDSNEVLEGKLLAGSTGYDVVSPSIEYLGRQVQAGIHLKLSKDLIPNLKNLDPKMMEMLSTMDPDNRYAIPYLWGTTGIGYNRAAVDEIMGKDFKMNTFDILFKPELIKNFEQCGIAFLDAPSEVFKAALFYIGKDPNTKDPSDYRGEAYELLKSIRPFIRYFHSSKYINDLANGEICLVFGWSGDILQAGDRAKEVENGINIDYQIPKEGAQMWVDMMSIPNDAPNSENAHLFLNFILKPEVMAMISNKVKFPNGIPDSKKFISKDILDNRAIYPDQDILNKLFIAEIANPRVDRVMTRQWINIKTGQ